MFELAKKNFFEDMWIEPALLFNTSIKELEKMFAKGKPILCRPHNLYTYKDDNGDIVGKKIEVVTTPFKKDEVTVELEGDTLTVKCGSENKKEDDVSSCVYHGISHQSYQFSLKIGEKVDVNRIEAKNEDGILTINMPFYKKENNEPKKIKVL